MLLMMLQTALHWAAKHGDENIVKLIAGTYKDYIKSVNETSVSSVNFLSEEKFYIKIPMGILDLTFLLK